MVQLYTSRKKNVFLVLITAKILYSLKSDSVTYYFRMHPILSFLKKNMANLTLTTPTDKTDKI